MKAWASAQLKLTDQLAEVHFFAMKKQHARGEIEFLISVREFIRPPDPQMEFLAQADKQTNQKTAPFTACGWGPTLTDALAECVKAVHRFPYEGPEAS